jgi:hypothetical protein
MRLCVLLTGERHRRRKATYSTISRPLYSSESSSVGTTSITRTLRPSPIQIVSRGLMMTAYLGFAGLSPVGSVEPILVEHVQPPSWGRTALRA